MASLILRWLLPLRSSLLALPLPAPFKLLVTLEHDLETPIAENSRVESVITLSSDDEVSPTQPPPHVIVGGDAPRVYILSQDIVSIVPLLKQLATMSGRKNILKTICVIYGNGKKEDSMDDRERTYQFHWTQSMVKYIEKYIPEELGEQHKKMCHQYRTPMTMDKAENLYHGLRAWWVPAGAVTEKALDKLKLRLAFWHFHYRQWGGFMTGVCFSKTCCFFVFFHSNMKHLFPNF